MKLTRPVVLVVLSLLFLVAIATRQSSLGRLDTPYFKGTAAIDYQHMLKVADHASLRAHDDKANAPTGYVPVRERACGAEFVSGMLYRGARFFSEIDGRQHARRVAVGTAALCVFTAYLLASSVWASQLSGLLAAFLIAFLYPLVVASNGRAFSHGVFAMLVGSVYAFWFLHGLRTGSLRHVVGAALAALALLAVWEPAPLLIVVWMVAVAFRRSLPARVRVLSLASQAGALIVSAVLFPHIVRTAGAMFVYALTRLRFAFGRPESPDAVTDWARSLWSLDHAPLTLHAGIEIALPVVLFATAALLGATVRAQRGRLFTTGAVLVAALAGVALDRALLPVAGLALAVVSAGAVAGLRGGQRVRIAIVAIAVFTALAPTVFRGKALDPAYAIARAGGVAAKDTAGFLWVSLENTDRELVRFVATRTSVKDTILAPRDVSALLLAFSGRTIVQLPGATARDASERHVALARALYRDEAALYEMCRTENIGWVLYSVDVLLDTGRYSPRWLAGEATPGPESTAYRMHFDAASLRHFTLHYENEHYRLFKVTAQAEPIFITDHPPLFQRSLFDVSGRDLDAFRERAVFLTITCGEGIAKRAAGDLEGAHRQLDWCVRNAPRYTRARMALAEVLIDSKRFKEARNVSREVVAYSPDNTQALYAVAYAEMQLGDAAAARPYLKLLFAQERDPEMLQKARTLEAYLDQKYPLPPQRP